MCLAQGPQCSDAVEARTRGPSVSRQALSHCAPTFRFLIALMIMYTMKVVLLKCQILMGFFSVLECKNVKVDLMVSVKMATFSARFVLKNA